MAVTEVYLAYVCPTSSAIQQLLVSDTSLLNTAASFKEHRRKTFLAGRGLLKLALTEQALLAPNAPLPPLDTGPSGKPFLATATSAQSLSPCDATAKAATSSTAASASVSTTVSTTATATATATAAAAVSAAGVEDDMGGYVESAGRLHFNISHSYDLIGLATGALEQGIDIESVRMQRMRDTLIRRVFGDKEYALYEAMDSLEEKAYFFTQQWTLRESLIKLTGKSIFKMDMLDIDPVARTITSELFPTGVVYCFKLPKAAGSSASLQLAPAKASTALPAGDVADEAATAIGTDTVMGLGLDNVLDCGLDESVDAVMSVFVHDEDVRECQRQGISPISIKVQAELLKALGYEPMNDPVQEPAICPKAAHVHAADTTSASEHESEPKAMAKADATTDVEEDGATKAGGVGKGSEGDVTTAVWMQRASVLSRGAARLTDGALVLSALRPYTSYGVNREPDL